MSDPLDGVDEPHAEPEAGTLPDPEEAHRSTRERIADLRARAGQLEQGARDRLQEEQARRGWVRQAVDAWERDRDRGGPLLAGGLAYRIFLLELPLALFFVSLLGVVGELAGKDAGELTHDAGLNAAIAATVAKAVEQSGSARWWLLLLGAWLTVWAGRSAVRAARLVSEIAWEMPLGRWKSSLKASLVFIGFVVVGTAIQSLVTALADGSALTQTVAWIAITLVMAAIATAGMTLLPHGGRHWTAVLPGSLLFAVCVRLLSLGTSIYFAGRIDRVDDLYGGLGLAIVILLWLYLIARLFVWGQFLSASVTGVGRRRLADAPQGADALGEDPGPGPVS